MSLAAVPKSILGLLAGLAVVGFLFVQWSTPEGIGLTPDSADYVGAARNQLVGKGLSLPSWGNKPMTHYPPLYPLTLSLFGLTGLDIIEVARWLNPLLFAANIVLFGLVLSFYTKSALRVVVLGTFLLSMSGGMLRVHAAALSEPQFLFLGFIGLILLDKHLESSCGTLLLLSGTCVGLAFLVRYAGAALVLTGLLGILLLSHASIRRRIRDVAFFSFLSCVPMSVWLLRNVVATDTLTNRKLKIQLITLDHGKDLARTVSGWFIPPIVPIVIRLLLAGMAISVLLFLFVALYKCKMTNSGGALKATRTRVPRVLVLFTLCYPPFLLASIILFDISIPLNYRILLPFFISALLTLLCIARRLFESRNVTHGLKVAFWGVTITLVALYFVQGLSWMTRTRKTGIGYASKAWRDSEVISWLRGATPNEVPVYSNGADAIYLLAGIEGIRIPFKPNSGRGRSLASYEWEMKMMGRNLREGNGFLVFFQPLTWRTYLPSEDKLRARLPLREVFCGADGTVYQYSPSSSFKADFRDVVR